MLVALLAYGVSRFLSCTLFYSSVLGETAYYDKLSCHDVQCLLTMRAQDLSFNRKVRVRTDTSTYKESVRVHLKIKLHAAKHGWRNTKCGITHHPALGPVKKKRFKTANAQKFWGKANTFCRSNPLSRWKIKSWRCRGRGLKRSAEAGAEKPSKRANALCDTRCFCSGQICGWPGKGRLERHGWKVFVNLVFFSNR